jgi:4-hydroxy-tetrahydrodipicolinate reductase
VRVCIAGATGWTGRALVQAVADAPDLELGSAVSRSAAGGDAMWQAAALLAARHLPQWEVIDYASAGKPDVPSGTARELAERLGQVRRPAIGRPLDEIHGPREARGADVAASRMRRFMARP